MELRSPDPTLNPYLGFALVLSAGLDGIAEGMELPPAVDLDLYNIDAQQAAALETLPQSLADAIALAKNSSFVKQVMGAELLSKYIAIKEEELAQFEQAEDKNEFYREQYFKSV